MTVTVYSTPSCVQCKATYRELAKNKIDYNVIDLTKDPEAMSKVKGLGYNSAPVVMVGDDHWSGFQPQKIRSLAAA